MRERRKRDVALFEAGSDVGKRIDEVRAERGWTIAELAKRSGVDSGNLSRLRLGDRRAERISVAHAFALADALGVETRWLFLGAGPKTTPSSSKLVEAHRLVRAAAELLEGSEQATQHTTQVVDREP
jgi:transcriptional regulator with XRE-family HTH domain